MHIGFDIGGTKILAVGLDDEGRVVFEQRVSTPTDLRALHACLLDLLSAAGDVDTIGVGVPGAVSSAGSVVRAPNLRFIEGLTALGLSEQLGRSVVLENDANCAALAEWRLGVGRTLSSMVLVTLGTGIGGGLVTDGMLVHGADGAAGEVGHMIVERDGRPCPCGQRGCWERYASGQALQVMARESAPQHDVPDDGAVAVYAAARRGEAWAVDVVRDHGGWIATGVISLLNLLNPQAVVFSGGLADDADVWLPDLRRTVGREWTGSTRSPAPQLVVSTFGGLAGGVGAALVPSLYPRQRSAHTVVRTAAGEEVA